MVDIPQPGAKPRLYHAPSSYYSMIARLALAEGGVAYEPVLMDILRRRGQQRPDYVRLNPHMTVPTLVLSDRVLIESRDIAAYGLGVSEGVLDGETKTWLDLHYAFPIEELTFGTAIARNPLARILIPRHLETIRRTLLARAAENPDLSGPYEARAALFAERVRTFDPAAAIELYARRRSEAMGLLDRLEHALRDGRAFLVPPAYGLADVVWTVFLARVAFVGLGDEIARRPVLARFWSDMQGRPSFAAADIWARVHVFRLIGSMLRPVPG
ncbi:glutathione S-transferase [Xanthobacter sp. KR7-65]|uniref:glutathione S-transferase family protein n=1 Tax=Xanthobacter sp. KR7-65 TaxID=3156612 RepID=UPI0032B61369